MDLISTVGPRACAALAGCALATSMVGCATTAKSAHIVKQFVVPAPRLPELKFTIQETPSESVKLPAPEPNVFLARQTPGDLAATVERSSRAPEVGYLLMQADRYFSNGSVLIGKGDAAGARVEFDRAIETLAAAPPSLPFRERIVATHQRLVEDIYRLEVEVANQAGTTPEPVFDKAPLEEVADLTFPIEPALKGKVRAQLQATVSQLPLEMADPVLSFINYFQSPRGRDTLIAGLRRSGRYAPMIRRILDEEGLPSELIYLAQAESGFLPRAVSYMSATGMWQFMQFRGREYGLNQSQFTDDRLDPEKATRAAAQHLRDLYSSFGDWYLAIAGYNCGPLAVERAVQRTGYADFWELYKRNVLPKETANYVPIILAMTIMAKNPKDYGLEGVVPDPGLVYDTIKVSANTHLALIADLVNRPLSEIRDLNPAVLRLIAPDGYAVHVPKGSGKQVLAALDNVPSVRRASWRIHRVSQQETVASIASKYKVTERSISEANAPGSSEPQAGDILLIPVAYDGPAPMFLNAGYSRYRRSAAKAPTVWRAPAKPAAKPAAARPTTAPKTAAKVPARTPVPRTVTKPTAPAAARKQAPANKAAAKPTPARTRPANRAAISTSSSGPTLMAANLRR